MIHRLDPPIPVTITSKTLPVGVKVKSRKAWAYGWEQPGIDSHRIWVCVLDEGGAVVDVPQPEIRVDENWTYSRRS